MFLHRLAPVSLLPQKYPLVRRFADCCRGATEPTPDASTGSGVRLPLTCGGLAGGGGAKDC
eukprot:10500700-Prorocentrum_lima.AAC.1